MAGCCSGHASLMLLKMRIRPGLIYIRFSVGAASEGLGREKGRLQHLPTDDGPCSHILTNLLLTVR